MRLPSSVSESRANAAAATATRGKERCILALYRGHTFPLSQPQRIVGQGTP